MAGDGRPAASRPAGGRRRVTQRSELGVEWVWLPKRPSGSVLGGIPDRQDQKLQVSSSTSLTSCDGICCGTSCSTTCFPDMVTMSGSDIEAPGPPALDLDRELDTLLERIGG